MTDQPNPVIIATGNTVLRRPVMEVPKSPPDLREKVHEMIDALSEEELAEVARNAGLVIPEDGHG